MMIKKGLVMTQAEGVITTVYSVKCMECSLHFNIYTWHPDKHNVKTVYCPECGQHDGKFFLWRRDVEEPIFMFVPYIHHTYPSKEEDYDIKGTQLVDYDI